MHSAEKACDTTLDIENASQRDVRVSGVLSNQPVRCSDGTV